MGTYLSTPVTEKGKEEGESDTLSWGVVDMQGWRKTMEDSHVAQTNVQLPLIPPANNNDNENNNYNTISVFGVFDGHGGPEVARFCGLYLVSVMQHIKNNNTESITKEDNNNDNDNGEVNHNNNNVNMGLVLKESFHALDRLIGTRKEELQRLRAIAPEPAEQRVVDNIPDKLDFGHDEPTLDTDITTNTNTNNTTTTTTTADSQKTDNNNIETTPKVIEIEEPDDDEAGEEDATGGADNNNNNNNDAAANAQDGEDNADDNDSNEATGKEEAAELDQDLSSDEEGDERPEKDGDNPAEEEPSPEEATPINNSNNNNNNNQTNNTVNNNNNNNKSTTPRVGTMFQRLLNISSPTGQVIVQVGKNGELSTSTQPGVDRTGPDASLPTIIRNGQLFCNLPDHPIHAGATAIVAVLNNTTNILTVANAGDSRAVLCRNGTAVALSHDHKPMQPTELSRIRNAGGFVNSFGRVNGNLNLSRSIGDLKYKQVPGLTPAQQMITAEPDIMEITINYEIDEFIILGCDGIWDVLTNEKAVEFVKTRIDTMTPTEIGTTMLDTIISDDPRATQGIGGDNMTVMIIDLQPHTRSYKIRKQQQQQQQTS